MHDHDERDTDNRRHIVRVARTLRDRGYANWYVKAYTAWKICELEGWFCFPPTPRAMYPQGTSSARLMVFIDKCAAESAETRRRSNA